MRFNVLVENHLGATRTRAVCEPCATRFPGRLLREPGSWIDDPLDRRGGYTVAGPLVVRESEHGSCSECGAGRAPVGYLRCCAFCNIDLLLDHKISNEVPVYCPKHADPAARR
jgi:hypothetical protein